MTLIVDLVFATANTSLNFTKRSQRLVCTALIFIDLISQISFFEGLSAFFIKRMDGKKVIYTTLFYIRILIQSNPVITNKIY